VNPTPSPVDVFIHSGPAEWWQILGALGPLAVLLGALLAGLISWSTLRQRTAADARALAQKREADNRAEWWKRTQWALDQALDEDQNSKALGLAALAVLTHSELARTEELELLDIAWKAVNGEDHDDEDSEDGQAPADDASGTEEPALVDHWPAVVATSPVAENVDSGDDMGDTWKKQQRRQRGGQEMSAGTPEQKKVHDARPASSTAGKPATASEHRVQVAAAKLRVALDERLGRPTPPKTKALAQENF
jgi:hypothetical protein